MHLSKVNRVEVIDNTGRAYVKYNVISGSIELQDDGKTLKIFVTYEEEEEMRELRDRELASKGIKVETTKWDMKDE